MCASSLIACRYEKIHSYIIISSCSVNDGNYHIKLQNKGTQTAFPHETMMQCSTTAEYKISHGGHTALTGRRSSYQTHVTHIIYNFSLLYISSLLCTSSLTEDTLGVRGDANGLLLRMGGKRRRSMVVMEPLRAISSENRGWLSNAPAPMLILRSRRPFGDRFTSPPLWHQSCVGCLRAADQLVVTDTGHYDHHDNAVRSPQRTLSTFWCLRIDGILPRMFYDRVLCALSPIIRPNKVNGMRTNHSRAAGVAVDTVADDAVASVADIRANI